MKTRNLILTVTLLMAGSWASNLMAQTNLNALMKKCESMEKVNVDVIYDKDRKTKKPVKEVITVTFSRKDNPKLLDEFLDAFRKDKEAAYKVMESKIDGKVMPSFYRFAVGTEKYESRRSNVSTSKRRANGDKSLPGFFR